MNETKPNPVIRVLPSLTDLAFLMPMVFLFAPLTGVTMLLSDGDTGFHVRAGDWILANGRVPDTDIFSFTRAGEPWFAWEWLWDASFAWLHQRWGLAAVVLASMAVISLTFALLFRLVRRKNANAFVGIAVTLLAAMASTIHWLARPHLFTLLFLVVFLSVLEEARDGRTRLLFWLPPLTVLWTNIHGGFFVGVIVVLCYAAGELATWLIDASAEDRKAALTRSKPYLLAGAGCVVASFVNPYTWRLHVHIYRYLTDTYHLRNIAEFQTLSFQHPMAIYFEAMLLLGLVAAVWNIHRRRFAYSIMLLGLLHTALVSARNIPIFVIAAAPVVVWTVEEMLQAIATAPVAEWVKKAAAAVQNLALEFGETDKISRVHVVSALGLCVFGAVLYAPAPPEKARPEYDPKRYPAKAMEMLRGPEFAQSVFTDDEWGDYLIYQLYPATKVFIDGRSDFYGTKFCERYIDIMNVKYGWQHKLECYGIDTVLLPVDASLAGALKESKRWRPVYDDGVAIIFRSAEAAWPAAAVRLARSERSSAVDCGGGVSRDREVAITKTTHNRDPRITQTDTRSEPL